MISIIAKIPVKEEKLNQAVEAVKQLMIGVGKEEGTLYYTLNISKSAPHTLVIMERYKDKEALGFHSTTLHFKAFMSRAGELFSGKPEITILEELASI
ncbi:MAG: antibiotic biosynthesis monooxygenase [Desulfobacca sp.]|nr:antibiotic biosynthesis monooxygenase [Desulfobacca sp.]